jgi:hypothetical protein
MRLTVPPINKINEAGLHDLGPKPDAIFTSSRIKKRLTAGERDEAECVGWRQAHAGLNPAELG